MLTKTKLILKLTLDTNTTPQTNTYTCDDEMFVAPIISSNNLFKYVHS